jgi:hypothetical protein
MDSVHTVAGAQVLPWPRACRHVPPCPRSDATDRLAARIIANHLQTCGYALLCNGVVMLEHGEVLDSTADPVSGSSG